MSYRKRRAVTDNSQYRDLGPPGQGGTSDVSDGVAKPGHF